MRERKTPDTIRAEASTRVSRLQAAINSLGDGDAEAKKVLESSLAKAQKQAEIPHTRQIEETREFIARARKRILHADEKIRLAEQAVAKQRRRRSTICENSRWQSPVWSVCRPRNESLHRALRLGSSDLISDAPPFDPLPPFHFHQFFQKVV